MNLPSVVVDEGFLSRVCENIPDVIYVSDIAESKILFRNRDFLGDLGFPSNAQSMGLLTMRDVVHKDDLDAFDRRLDAVRTARDTESVEVTCRMKTASDEWRWFEIKNRVHLRSSDGTPTQILGSIQDISKQKERETQLIEMVRSLQSMEDLLRERQDQLEELNHRLAGLASTDGLTGVYNYRAFHDKLEEEIRRARRYDYPLAVLVADVDDFKLYNDQFGHPAGDERLRGFAQMLMAETRESDFVCRTGGEEFAVVLSNTGATNASQFAQRIVDRLNEDVSPKRLTASFGCVQLEISDLEKDDILKRADACLYEAKRMGKNCVVMESKERKAAFY